MIEESLHAIQQRMAECYGACWSRRYSIISGGYKEPPCVSCGRGQHGSVSTHVGENRVQEAKEKQLTYKGPQLTWHLIGHLQVNKVRQAVPMFDLIHSVDSRKLLDEIEKVAAKHDKIQDVLLQVNVAREASKTGMTVEEFPEIRDYAKTLPHVRVRGLMCMAPFFDDPQEARPIFRVANALFEDMKRYFEEGQIQYLSMGMTHDFEVALEEGANIVRVGTAIFGERVYY